MRAEQYAQVKALFAELCDLPVLARAERLRAGTKDTEVIEFVLALLEQSQTPAVQIGASVQKAMNWAATEELRAGDLLGAWKIIAPIGQGGMGSLFLVQRNDGHFRQRAALKVLKGVAHAKSLELLARERQLLASLAHPNIARLLDGGATPAGHPWLVMEFIDGLPIDKYCRAQKLDQAAILRLFVQACSAVAFAHRQLIVHCDLKPANLLVNTEGRPILLDFGIAKLIDSSGSVLAISPAYTPGYASPEQKRSEPVTIASDIYSLGVMLKELLAPTFLAQGKASARTTRRTRELQAITKKCTADAPAARYRSVDALTDDIERFLQHIPLRAMPDVWHYRSEKLVRRRWPWLLASAAFMLCVTLFSARLLWESQRAKRAELLAVAERDQATAQRDRANVAEASAERINAFLASVLSSVDPDNAKRMDTRLMRSILSQAAVKAQIELRKQPRELHQINSVIADSYASISDFRQAVRYYELAQVESVGSFAESELSARLQLMHKHAKALIALRKHDAAGVIIERGIAEASLKLGKAHALTLAFYTLQAERLFDAGLREQGLALAEENYLRMKKASISDQDIWFELLNSMAVMNSDSSRFERAQALLQELILLSSKSTGATSARTLRTRNSLAVLLLQSKRHAEAVQLLRPLAKDVDSYLGENHVLAISLLSNLGIALRLSGEERLSGEYYVNAHARALAAFGENYSLTLELANNLAIYELRNAQAPRALRRIDDVLEIIEPSYAKLDPLLVEALRTRARALAAMGQIEIARVAWREVIARDLALYGPKDAQTVTDQAALGALEKR